MTKKKIPCKNCMLIPVCRNKNLQDLVADCSKLHKYLDELLWGSLTLVLISNEIDKFGDVNIYKTPYSNIYDAIQEIIDTLDSITIKVKLGRW